MLSEPCYTTGIPRLLTGYASDEDTDPAENALNDMFSSASVCEQQGDLKRAEELLLNALSFAKSTFGEKSLFTANALTRISSFYNRREKYLSARHYMDELMDILDNNSTSDSDCLSTPIR